MEKKQLTLVVVSLLVVVLSVSVAYFTAQIIGEGKTIDVASANLQVIFSDTDGAIASTDIEPGWTSTKIFTVKNESNGTYKYNIIIKDLVNTFTTSGFLVYKITSTDGGYTMADFADVPKSSTATDTTIAESISIEKGKTHTYKIIINYNNSDDVDQSADMDKMLSGKIFIQKYETTLVSKLLENNPTISTRSDFSTAFTTNTPDTVYKATENGTDVYYFAGVDVIEEHCEYNGKKIVDYSSNKLNENTCSREIEVCHTDTNEYLYFGMPDCKGFDGSVEKIQVLWVSGIEKPINNWVKFGKNSSNQDLYWRIIRTNSDGGIRLLYHGTSTTATDAYIGISKFNEKYNDPMYVGYMHGASNETEIDRSNTNNSTIKTYIDSWYANNLTNYTKYLSTTAIYCNDREVGSGTYSATGSTFYYKAQTRLYTNKPPTYDCANTSDAFSVSNTSAKLTYPIGLMTADEISFAGGVYQTNAPAYYYQNSAGNSSTGSTRWYTMSPFDWDMSYSNVFLVDGSTDPGYLNYSQVDDIHGVRPAISLKSCIKYGTGNGSASSPYTIDESYEC